MEKHWSTVCALTLVLGAFLHFNLVFAAESDLTVTVPRPGICPRYLNVVPSQVGCTRDEDCPAKDKCCVFASGAVCLVPSTVKPGRCPRRRWLSAQCMEHCSKDTDCPDSERCCHNGCGHDCVVPYTVKRGRCPLPQRTPMCAEFCYHDGECPGEQKCCKTTCGHACTEPC